MKIMVVSPHPDDETLGAGGTLIKMKKQGHQIYWMNVTDMGVGSIWNEMQKQHRQRQIRRVRDFYEFDGFYNLGYPAAALSGTDEGAVISDIRRVFGQVRPEWLIIPGTYDAHSDHRIVYHCCMACAKTFRAPYIQRVTTMEILSETGYGSRGKQFEPNLLIDISAELEDKLKAMEIYDTETEEAPFPRSLENIRALAMVRGSSAMCRYAEAFCIEKMLE